MFAIKRLASFWALTNLLYSRKSLKLMKTTTAMAMLMIIAKVVPAAIPNKRAVGKGLQEKAL